MSKMWRGLLLLSLLLMSISSVAAHDSKIEIVSNSGFSSLEQSGESDNASVRVIPDEGLAGNTHTILIGGLNDGEEITVSILYDGEEVYFTERTADSRGRVEIDIFTELTDPVGDYTVEVLNASGVVIGSDTLTINEPLGLNAALEISPTEAEVGTIFELTISNAQPFVDLQILFRDADGVVVYSTIVRADAEGIASTEFPTEDIEAGTYSIRVVRESDRNLEVAHGEVTVLGQVFAVRTSIEPTETRPNREVSISIDSLEAETTATIEIVSTNEEIVHSEEIIADENGAASLVYAVPEDAVLGDYTVRVLQDGELVSEANFLVFDPEFVVNVTPENGTPNTNFFVEIVGLDENETVKVEIANASGVIESIEVTADSDGNADALLGEDLLLEIGMYAIRVMRGDTVAFGLPIEITEELVSPESNETPEISSVIVTVDPESGPIPTTYTFRVEGATANTELSIDILFEGEVIFTTSSNTDADGIAEFGIVSETTDPEGVYTLEVYEDGERIGSVDFIAGDAPAETDEIAETEDEGAVSISLNPDAVLQGERAEILVNNLEAGETVTIEMRYDGETVYSVERQASESGIIGLAVRIEESDPIGVYEIVVLRGEEVIANAALNVARDESELPEAAPEISVSPASGPIGTDHIIEITGLKVEESLDISLEFEGEVVYSTERTADADGQVVLVIGSELEDSPGEYAIRILREDGTELSSSLIIEDAILMGDAEIMIEPSSGVMETDHRITVTGLLPNESVTLDIEFDGEVVYTTERTADENGLFIIDITSQEGDAYGEYDVIVRRDNGDESSSSFIVESPFIDITVEPEFGPIETDYVFTITGLAANSSYDFVVEYDGNVVYSSTVDSDNAGEAQIVLTSQEGDDIGEYQLIILSDNVEIASIDFEVTGDDIAGVQVTIEPESGIPTSVHEVTITGLIPRETVTLEVEFEGNTVYETELTADDTGVATINLESEADDELGEYLILILRDGDLIASGSLLITDKTGTPIAEVDGTVYRGRINANTGEVVFTFSGDAGQEMLIGLSSNEFDAYLILQDENGQELASNDNYGNGSNAQISPYALPYSGEYRVIVSSADYQAEHETVFGNFVLMIEPFNSISSDYGETVTVEFDETTVSQFIEFEAQAGDVISIGADSNGSVDTVLSVLDPSGIEVVRDDDGGQAYDSEINRLVLSETGIYTVIIRSFVDGESGEADVTIQLEEQQTLDNDTRLVELSSKQNSSLLVFEGQAGEMVILTVSLESGNTASLHISANQADIELMGYQTVALPDAITLSFIVPDDGLVSIYVEDAAVEYAVLSFEIERE